MDGKKQKVKPVRAKKQEDEDEDFEVVPNEPAEKLLKI
jgi:methyltransferase